MVLRILSTYHPQDCPILSDSQFTVSYLIILSCFTVFILLGYVDLANVASNCYVFFSFIA